MFNYVLHIWGIKRDELRVAFLCDSSEMVKAIAENGIGAAILPKIRIKNELKLEDLRPILVRKTQKELNPYIETNQFTLKLKHSQRYQTKLAIAFEQMSITNSLPIPLHCNARREP